MKLIAVALLTLTALGIMFWPLQDTPTPPDDQPATETPRPTTSNPFGVMLGTKATKESIQALGAPYYRPVSLFTDTWNGTCKECEIATSAGKTLILTVRTNGGKGVPSTPPANLTTYKVTLEQMLTSYEPEVLVVENEEHSAALFYSGTPQDYHRELTAACEVAHAAGVKCTNGGFVSSMVAILVAHSYQERGDTAKANEYLRRALGPKLEDTGINIDKLLTLPRYKEQIKRGLEFLAGYKAAGADYINFHWYIADTAALQEAVTFLETFTGLPAMTNEVGQQKNTNPEQVTSVMQQIVDLGLPYAVWFSVDIEGYGGATSLVDMDGTLRSNGQAFAEFITKTY